MMRTRVIVGSILAAIVLGLLFIDESLKPWYPLLYLLGIGLGLASCWEFLSLIPPYQRPHFWIATAGVVAAISGPWLHIAVADNKHPGLWSSSTLIFVVMAAFLHEMRIYQGPGQATTRVAWTALVVIYLGVMPSYLFALRWLNASESDPRRGLHALLLAIFVPKCGDIGAYFTGKLLGRHRMTPLLSPKKTWEGAVGSLVGSVVAAILGSYWGARPEAWAARAAGFGLVVGVLGMLGDLAESLLKRESSQKDSSDAIPGFGGVLDVIDSVVFTAPVSYLWLSHDSVAPL
jgi:phosphatidate cytidylyltransferase